MTIETKVQAQSSSLSTYAASLDSLRGKIDGWVSSAVSYRSSIQDVWSGTAANACDTKVGKINKNLREVAEQLQTYKTAVTSLKDQISSVEQSMNSIRSEASGAGLTVRGTVIEPPPPVVSSDPVVIAEAQRKVDAYTSLASQASAARSVESAAHTAFGTTCSQISTDPVWNDFRNLLSYLGGINAIDKLVDNGGKALSYLGIFALYKKGRFAFRINGKYAKFNGSFKELFDTIKNSKNWQNVKNASDSARKVVGWGKKTLDAAEKLGKFSKGLGAASAIFDGTKGFTDQWTADSQDPTLGTGEKVVRATAKAAWEAGGGWAAGAAGGVVGFKVGVSAGSAIGTVIPGVGTVIGGLVGGAIGGLIGSGAVSWAKEKLDGFIDGLIDKIRW